ncbi:MAG TPA: NAD(P)-dependent oxidoreductase [Candidatus Krumholzibacteria bacterium]|nr:NAD(P)-dependent oxidoreductase [Candidatus Krumholzibacteria bacterium]
MTRCAFLGLGIMGRPMALNLLKAGFPLTVWNRDPAKTAPLVDAGAAAAPTAREAAAGADLVFVMVSDPAAALAVARGADGALAGLRPGAGYVDFSTVDPGTSAALAAEVAAAGGRFLEAPVSGSKGPAEQGTLVILAAGDRDLYDQAGPALDAVGKLRLFLGEAGAGARMKLVVNMVMGGMMTAFSEGLALADRAGLDAAQLQEVLAAGAVANPMFALKGPLMAAGRDEPAFPLKHMRKDLRLARALGEAVGQRLPTAAAADALFVEALDRGLGDRDFSAVHRVVSGRAAG